MISVTTNIMMNNFAEKNQFNKTAQWSRNSIIEMWEKLAKPNECYPGTLLTTTCIASLDMNCEN